MSDVEYDYSLSAAMELKFSLLAQLVFPSTYWSQSLSYILKALITVQLHIVYMLN